MKLAKAAHFLFAGFFFIASSFAIEKEFGDEQILLRLLEEYYDSSYFHATRSEEQKNKIATQLEQYSWDHLNVGPMVFDFFYAKAISNDQRVFPYQDQIPNVFLLANEARWCGYLLDELQEIQARWLPYESENLVFYAVLDNFIINRGEDSNTHSKNLNQLLDGFYNVYKDTKLSSNSYKIHPFFSPPLLIGFAIRLGDERAFSKSFELIKGYTTIGYWEYYDQDTIRNLSQLLWSLLHYEGAKKEKLLKRLRPIMNELLTVSYLPNEIRLMIEDNLKWIGH